MSLCTSQTKGGGREWDKDNAQTNFLSCQQNQQALMHNCARRCNSHSLQCLNYSISGIPVWCQIWHSPLHNSHLPVYFIVVTSPAVLRSTPLNQPLILFPRKCQKTLRRGQEIAPKFSEEEHVPKTILQPQRELKNKRICVTCLSIPVAVGQHDAAFWHLVLGCARAHAHTHTLTWASSSLTSH